MKKTLIIAFFIIGLTLLNGCYSKKTEQNKLAHELGVEIEEYPYASSFPIGYFYTLLGTYMSIHEVHEIMSDYKAVYSCGDSIEVYYYLSTDAKRAKRVMITYDGNGQFLEVEGEDEDSRYFDVSNCTKDVRLPDIIIN